MSVLKTTNKKKKKEEELFKKIENIEKNQKEILAAVKFLIRLLTK